MADRPKGAPAPPDPLASLRLAQQMDNAARLAHAAYPALASQPALVRRFLDEMDDPLFARLWELVAPYTVVDLFRAKSLCDAARESLDRPGELVECGVAGGGLSLLLALLVREVGSAKRVHLCDSFAGLPAPGVRDTGYAAGEFATSAADVRALLQEHGVTERCVFHEGWFSETLSRLPAELRFCFAHIDCDLYDSTLDCLAGVYPRVSPGGALVFDDYNDGCHGVMAAVHEHIHGTGELLFLGPTAQATIRKGVSESGETLRVALDGRGWPARDAIDVTVSLERLRGDRAYDVFLEQLEEEWAARVERLGELRRRLVAVTNDVTDGSRGARRG